MTRHISTYFDINFLPRGLALYDSLCKNSKDFKYYVLALDDVTYQYLLDLKKENIIVIKLQDYIEYFQIDKTKYKTEKEFYFSITPALNIYILEHYKDIDILLYLDADVYLFNDLEIVYGEIGDSSIAICPQRLPWYIKIIAKNYGIYNVGVNAFRNDNEGMRCLKEWYNDCSTWVEGQEGYKLSFFSDQIWLDSWPKKYRNLKIIRHIGINTAPWNAMNYNFSHKNGYYYVNDKPLVIYHFSSLKRLSKNIWHGNTTFTILNLRNVLLLVYQEYLKNVERYEQDMVTSNKKLDVEGSKIKLFIYSFLKNIHNHIVKVEEN